MRRAVLLAHPAGHSLSPAMHDAAFAACGMQARYEAWDVAPADLAAAVARIREDPSLIGANVTVPHKRSVIGHLDALSGEAAAIGAVNTVRREEGRLVGDNTDAEGFLRSLADAGLDPAGRVVVLLGAGGAARAAAWALLRSGVAELRIVNRTAASARSLAADLTAERATLQAERGAPAGKVGHGTVRAVPMGGEEVRRNVDWWVNATSVGMLRGGKAPDETPLAASAIAPAGAGEKANRARAAIDLVYRPRRTRFLREADAAGLVTVDGLGMLLHQGAVAFEAWTGREAPLAAMRAVLERSAPREPL